MKYPRKRQETRIYPDIPTAVQHMVHTERTIEPDPARHEEYGFWIERYIGMYESVKDEMHKTARHVLDAD